MVDVLNDPHGEVHNWPAEPSPDLEMVVGPPAFSRFLRNVLIIFGGLALITVLLVVVRDTKYSPSAAVDGYLSALAERDTKAALERLDPQSGANSTSLLHAAVVQSPDYSPPTNYKITKVETDGDRSAVTVSMTIGGSPTTMEFDLVRDSASLSKVFRPWRITNGLGAFAVYWPYGANVIVAGERLSSSSDGSVFAAGYPGSYVVSNDSAVLNSAPITVAVTQDRLETIPKFTVTLKDSVGADVNAQIQAKLAGCAAQTTLTLTGCPFSVDNPRSGTPSNVVWTVNTAPTVEISIQPTYVQVTTKAQGSASVTVRFTDSRGKAEDASGTYTFGMDGYVVDNAGKATFVAR